MRPVPILLLVWITIGLVAAYERGYLSERTRATCANYGTIAMTAIAGPLNYAGINPKVRCEDEPSR